MIGTPFEGSWDTVTDAAYYTGAGGEAIWLWISIALCILACVIGHMHEARANSD